MSAPWPSANDYLAALQHPDRAFKDPILAGCKAETNRLRQPKGRSGNFAIVYKLLRGGTPCKAVRVFRYPGPEREERYRAVSDHLKRGRPDSIIGFEYDPEGIQVNGQRYPIVVMDWVEGSSLDKWVGETVQRGDSRALAQMAERWVQLVIRLRQHQIAHGDLQHGNVMVVGAQPVLVDYDCMCVPSLVGRPALEAGMPAYQHPERAQQLSLELDNFAAWIILIALRALASELDLYERYVRRTGNENLLFAETDIKDPAGSALWRDLLRCRDPEVQEWARRLKDTLPHQPFDRVPTFDPDPSGQLRTACKASPRAWDVIAGLAAQLGARLPADLVPLADEARRRTACREAVEKAIQARSLRQLASAYDHTLLDDWPACAPLLPRARGARPLLVVLDRLETLVKNPGNGRPLVALWDQHAAQLGEYVEPERTGQAVAAWRQRIEACDAFLQAVRSPSPQERAIAGTWARLQRAGGHPDADPFTRQGQQARPRADLLDRLKAIPAAPTEINDRSFERTWDEALLKDCGEAVGLRPRLAEVRARLPRVDALRQAIAQADRGGEEKAVVDAAGPVSPGYAPDLEGRVDQARRRVEAAAQLTRAQSAVPISDCALADAWDQARAAGAVRCSPQDVKRCELAVRRRDCLRRLRTIDAPALPVNEQDQRWVLSWDATLLQDCEDARPLQARWTQARDRLARLGTLRQAIAQADRGGEEKAVVEAAGSVAPGYAPELEGRVALARRRLAAATDLDRALVAVPLSDCALADAWEKARDAGRERRPRQDVERCLLAVRRRDCLRRLQSIDQPALPLDEQDERWVLSWDKDLLQGCEDARPLQPRWSLALKRLADWKVLEDVLRTHDLVRIREAAAASSLKGYPRVQLREPEIDQLLQEAEGLDQLLERLRRPNAAELLTGADLKCIRDHAAILGAKKGQIESMLQDWLKAGGRLTPGTPPSLQEPGSPLVTVFWRWPHFERISHCLVAASPDGYCANPSDAREGVLQWTAEDHRRCGGGAALRPEPGRSTLYVTIWPVIDLGWTQLVGQPLKLAVPVRSPRADPDSSSGSWFSLRVKKARRSPQAGADDF